LRILGVSGAAFVVVLLTLVLIPRQATRSAARLLEGTAERPDTAALAAQLDQVERALAASELAVARRRAEIRARQQRAAASESLAALSSAAAPRTRRDSLAAAMNELNRLLERAERSPLPASYRALASASPLRRNPRVQVLLDSLGDVERARNAFDAAGGVDPIFMALTSRVNALGRSLELVAAAKRDTVRSALTALGGPPAAPPAVAAAVDTTQPLARVDSARRAVDRASAALTSAHARDAALDARMERAHAIATESASPAALIGAALVLAIAVGFGVTLGAELRTPRVADAAEAERVSGTPTLAIVGARPSDPQRMRRRADHTLSPLIDTNSQSYRYVYARVREDAATGAVGVPLVAVTGDEAAIVATIAANVAIAGVHDARTALLIDADPEAAIVGSIVHVPRMPGVSDALAGRVDWAAAVRSTVVGRDRTLDVIAAGGRGSDPTPLWPAVSTGSFEGIGPAKPGLSPGAGLGPGRESGAGPEGEPRAALRLVGSEAAVDTDAIRTELYRLVRRYELIVLVAPAGAARVGPASVLPVSDAIVCARVAYTTLARLEEAVASLQASGARVRGVVLWDGDVPSASVVEASVPARPF
jgi:Mrp family chromosome partitioning ATPase